jgi:hypothetical protein
MVALEATNVTRNGCRVVLPRGLSGCASMHVEKAMWIAATPDAGGTVSGGAYSWKTTLTGSCSAVAPSCGTAYGSQSQTVTCVNASTGRTVANSRCSSSTRPPTTASCSAGGTDGCRCFIAGTQVTMADGSTKDIEDVEIGDTVLGKDGAHNEVLDFERPMLGNRQLFSINGGEYFVTPAHPFHTTDGWKSIDINELHRENTTLVDELAATSLQVGDEIIKADGSVELVLMIDGKDAEDQQLYNFRLSGDRTYFVNGLLTHTEFSSEE